MKNLVLILAAAFILSSCNKNSSVIVVPASTGNIISGGGTGGGATGTPPTNSLIVGKWLQVSDTTKFYTNGVLMQTTTDGKQTTPLYQFNSDGSGVYQGGAFTFSLSGTALSLNFPGASSQGVTVPPFSLPATVKTLNTTTLFLYFDYSAQVSVNGQTQTSRTVEVTHMIKQ